MRSRFTYITEESKFIKEQGETEIQKYISGLITIKE